MTPDIPTFLRATTMRLLTEVAPALPPGYGQSSTATLGLMLTVAAKSVEDAIDGHAWDNRAMRALFARAASLVPWPDLAEAASGADEDLRLSALTRVNGDLKRLLIRLQAALEDDGSAEAGALRRAIWDHLVEAAERRRIEVPSAG